MLNKSGKKRHFVLIPDLKRKCFQHFTIEYYVGSGLVIYGLYYIEVCSSYINFVENCFFLIVNEF